MAMTNGGLSAKIKTEIEAIYGAPDDDARLQQFCDALGKAIVEYIQANAVVTASGPDPQGGTQNVTGTVS